MGVASHELHQEEERIAVPPGLKGVLAVSTGIGDVRGREGFYHYRHYSAIDLAEKCSFEEVWHLLIEGALPNARELADFREELVKHRVVTERVNALLERITLSGIHADPLSFLRSAVSIVGGEMALEPSLDLPIEKLKEEAVSIASIVPLALARYHRWSTGQPLIDADPTASFASNYLHLVTGKTPSPEAVRGLDKYLIATIDHGLNSSTFTARVIASTGADIAACVVGAIGALSGPLHGGAPSRALDTLDEMRTVPDPEAWIREKIAAGEKLMGFGHAVYRTEDPRSRMLRKACAEIGGEQYEYAVQAETLILRLLAEMKPGRELHTNVEFYAGVLMDLCGLPREMFTPTFACSRVVGWVSHVLEQVANNKIIRPSSLYIGSPPPMPVPSMENR